MVTQQRQTCATQCQLTVRRGARRESAAFEAQCDAGACTDGMTLGVEGWGEVEVRGASFGGAFEALAEGQLEQCLRGMRMALGVDVDAELDLTLLRLCCAGKEARAWVVHREQARSAQQCSCVLSVCAGTCAATSCMRVSGFAERTCRSKISIIPLTLRRGRAQRVFAARECYGACIIRARLGGGCSRSALRSLRNVAATCARRFGGRRGGWLLRRGRCIRCRLCGCGVGCGRALGQCFPCLALPRDRGGGCEHGLDRRVRHAPKEQKVGAERCQTPSHPGKVPRPCLSVAHVLGLAAPYFALARASFRPFFLVVTSEKPRGNLPQDCAGTMYWKQNRNRKETEERR
jgi:hypothetical protein